ncbi:MAG: hypothetical protein AAF492_12675, partial [Verrucomicrobiota bacterium]
QWYNRRNERRGPLWEERFKSVILDGTSGALLTLASYIDLNPIRAGICEDPKDYRWCGYGEAVAGIKTAREGLQEVMSFRYPDRAWENSQKQYRMALFDRGEASFEQKGFDKEQVKAVLEADGTLNRFELLRCRVRYFSDGVALGSQAFVEDVFQEFRDRFGQKRGDGCRTMKGLELKELFTIRDLRKDVILVPD